MFMYLVNYGIVDHLKSFVDTFYDFIVDCGVLLILLLNGRQRDHLNFRLVG